MTPTELFLASQMAPGGGNKPDPDVLRAAYLKALTGNASVRHWLESAGRETKETDQ